MTKTKDGGELVARAQPDPSLGPRADAAQREMVRHCAGIDVWDQMPVVVEGWLRVLEQLIEAREALLAELARLNQQYEELKESEEASIGCAQSWATRARKAEAELARLKEGQK